MDQSTESKNKALVLEAFDTLFNERDYAAAERFWSSNYIQHSAHIEPGREGLFNLIKGTPIDRGNTQRRFLDAQVPFPIQKDTDHD
jgi:predicted SnoaL-like aldol condensation-catalyzing enzyme